MHMSLSLVCVDLGALSAGLDCLGDVGEVLALVLGQRQLLLARHPAAVSSSEGTCSVCRSAVYLAHVELHLPECVADGHEDHAVVGELRQGRQSGSLLSAGLCGCREEDASGFADQLAALPQTPRRIPHRLHLCTHGAEASGRAEQNAVRVGQRVHVHHGDVCVFGRCGHLLEHLIREGLRHLVQEAFAAGLLDALLHLLRQRTHVAIHGVEDDVDFGFAHVAASKLLHTYLVVDAPELGAFGGQAGAARHALTAHARNGRTDP
mmetsp:Transcript_34174/g.84583  ORF Transcript_34174/g.84583 Transcript_34174/m.84583 type:complete len:264 (+) Transcript_34174:973-1764(+)